MSEGCVSLHHTSLPLPAAVLAAPAGAPAGCHCWVPLLVPLALLVPLLVPLPIQVVPILRISRLL